jgi:hypothetical protein
MKVQLNEGFLNPDGLTKLMVDQNKILTMRDVCINSLLSPVQGENPLQKEKKYILFKLIRDGADEMDLKAEDIVLLKDCIGKFQSTLVMGQCFEALGELKIVK